jgi:NAD(P)-dependent dehydrogenase (short-subunit alcohol dehydrogenase family)
MVDGRILEVDAIDLARHRIRVNTIAPTLIETPMTKPFVEDVDFRGRVLAEIKLGRLNVCPLVLLLARWPARR